MRPIHLSLVLILAMCSVSFSATNVSSCQAITAPGVYELISDLSGAPIDASPLTGSACIKIATSDVVLDCKGLFNIENNGTGGTTIGIHINGTSTQPIDNVTVKNCTTIANYSYGVYASYLNDSSFTKVWALGNTQDGFKFDNSDHITLSECVGNNNGGYGYYAGNPQFHSLNEFTAGTNGGGGVFSSAPFGGYISGSSTFGNADDGIRVDGGSGLSISSTSSNNNGNNGISIDGSTNTIIDDSAVSNNTRDGIWLNGTNTISVTGTTSSGNQRDGISIDGSTNTIIDDSAVSGNVRDGILSIGDDDFTISGTSSNNNGRHGISLDGSTGTISDESEFSGNTRHGISLDGSTLTLEGSSSSSNRENGIYSYRSSLDVTDFASYANAKEMVVNDTGAISMSGVEFRPFSGNRIDYTKLSITDNIGSGESYSIKWNFFRGLPPSGLTFLGDKIVEITVESGSPSVDSITWHWSDDEVVGINEAGIELWKNSEAVWSQVSGDINTALNTFTIRDHTSFSTFALFHNGSASYTADLQGVNVTNITHRSRYNSTPAGNISTEGGNVSGVNVSQIKLTDRWAAFYGNITGEISLRTDDAYVYKWSWNNSGGGVMCMSTNSSLPSLVYGASGIDIDTVWNFGNVADNGNITFNNSDCVLDGTQINGSTYADTGPAGGFTTCALKTSNSTLTSKDQMLFCSDIASGTAYDGQPADFEVLVPTNQNIGTTETYYLFASLS